MRAVNRVSMSMGWGAVIPQTPATTPKNTPRPTFTPVAGITPATASGGANVVIPRKEYDRLRRKEEKRQHKREKKEKKERKKEEKEKREKEDRREKRGNGDSRRGGNGELRRDKGDWRRDNGDWRRDNGDWSRDNGDSRRDNGDWRNGGRRYQGNKRDYGERKGFWGSDNGYDEMRHLGGLCGRCGENHASRECPHDKESLRCTYPPCIDKFGHNTKVCHELMKRCRLPVCEGQRGHRAKSHFQPDDVIPFGKDRRAAMELRRMYEDYKDYLTDEEKRIVVRYESRQTRMELDTSSARREASKKKAE